MARLETSSRIANTPFPSNEVGACPYPYYEALRQEAPVYQLPGRDEYVLSRYEDVMFASRHPEIFSSRSSRFDDGWQRRATLDDLTDDQVLGIVNSDPPRHTEKRRLAFQMFKPGKLRAWEPMIVGIADDLIDRFADRGEVEFVSEFANLLPTRVIFTILGLPLEDVGRAVVWGHYEGSATRYAPRERQEVARQSILELSAYMGAAIAQRHAEPTDDELSRFVQAHVERDGALDLPNVVSDSINVMIGGIVTTAHLMSSLMLLLLRSPEQMASVRADYALIRRAIEESLRCESPVQWTPRLVLSDTEVGGVPIPAGSIVFLVWGSVNRDEAVFEATADEFDIGRANVQEHMAFGNGTHFCIGAPLARLEARLSFERLLTRLDPIWLPEGKNDFATLEHLQFHGRKHLHLGFDVAGATA